MIINNEGHMIEQLESAAWMESGGDVKKIEMRSRACIMISWR